MNNKKSKYYAFNECKTEFLFESDAEKVVLKEAEEKLKPKKYKYIIRNFVILSLLIMGIFFGLTYYMDNTIDKINASVVKQKSISIDTYDKELLNKYSKDLITFDINYNKKYEVLVNKANPMNEENVSSYNLVKVENNYYDNIKLEEETYKNYLKLKDTLAKKGYYINIKNGFRSFNDSIIIYKSYANKYGEKYAKKYITNKGESEHNTGLAFDYMLSSDEKILDEGYDKEKFNYLESIAHLYGFIIRYPKDKENITGYSYEPWHLRYVGQNASKYIKKNNLTLEEYYAL